MYSREMAETVHVLVNIAVKEKVGANGCWRKCSPEPVMSVDRTLGFCALRDMEIGDCKHLQKETAASQHKDKVMKIHSSQDPQK